MNTQKGMSPDVDKICLEIDKMIVPLLNNKSTERLRSVLGQAMRLVRMQADMAEYFRSEGEDWMAEELLRPLLILQGDLCTDWEALRKPAQEDK